MVGRIPVEECQGVYSVMAGLVPAIHVFGRKKEDVDARHKRRA